MTKYIKITDEELRKRMQELIDNIADQLKQEAVNTLCSEETSVPMSARIVIDIGTDMITSITYRKIVYSYPISKISSFGWRP